ncbi:AGE family epimerase/isomerase [Vallitalea okinawensis]|uniref:AGE family epimerase/isomerase n=1 Tax=Vallitalea okinawensis TaxID=2078660 RepID=UPI001A9A45E9|nr:AGE family epimerase/isomerase [Vallitalea okinawensis]
MIKLREEVAKELSKHIMPFWINLKDEENGGFYGNVDYDLKVDKKGVKGGIASSRLLWSFSAAYRVTKEEKNLVCAHHAYDFLVNNVYDTVQEGLFWLLDHEGNPIDTRKHIYAQAFGIYALSEYYRVSQRTEALKLAKKLYSIIETRGYDKEKNAYLEEFNRQWIKQDNEMLSENGIIADITTNTHLHVLEAYTNLYRVWPNNELKKKLMNIIDIFYNKIFDNKTKFLKVFFDNSWNELIDLKSYGHDIEASWLLDDAIKLLRLKNDKYDQMVVDIAYNIANYAIQNDGSIINEKENNIEDYSRIWWGQAEAIVGFLNAYERTEDERFSIIIHNLWAYIQQNLIDVREGGEWFWSIEDDGQPSIRAIAEPWKTPYHNARFCLEILERVK